MYVLRIRKKPTIPNSKYMGNTMQNKYAKRVFIIPLINNASKKVNANLAAKFGSESNPIFL